MRLVSMDGGFGACPEAASNTQANPAAQANVPAPIYYMTPEQISNTNRIGLLTATNAQAPTTPAIPEKTQSEKWMEKIEQLRQNGTARKVGIGLLIGTGLYFLLRPEKKSLAGMKDSGRKVQRPTSRKRIVVAHI